MKKTTDALIVQLQGGMGNQMFQYAFGKALEKKFKKPVLFDASGFEEAEKTIVDPTTRKNAAGVCVRQYELYIFSNINLPTASRELCDQIKGEKTGKLSRLLFHKPLYDNLITENNAFRFEPALLKKRSKGYYTGYFQNENYFKSLHSELKHDFMLPPMRKDDSYNQGLLHKIEQAPNSVFIHVRREDYVNLNFLISMSYYKNAVAYIKKHVQDPKFFVFCAEDPEWVRNNFDIGCEYELIGEANKTRETFYENMRLMMACKHAIIANSSYSWWAAWLSDFEGKIVIAPSPWMNGQDEVVCQHWIKIKNGEG